MANKRESYISLWETVVSEGYREKFIGFSEKGRQKSELYPCFTLILGENILVPFPKTIYPFSIQYIFYFKKSRETKDGWEIRSYSPHSPPQWSNTHIQCISIPGWLSYSSLSLFPSQVLADLDQYDVIYLLDHRTFPGRIQSNYPVTRVF